VRAYLKYAVNCAVLYSSQSSFPLCERSVTQVAQNLKLIGTLGFGFLVASPSPIDLNPTVHWIDHLTE
jgi:hypothetical protein